MELFDTHCHLDADYAGESVDALLERAAEAGVTGIVLPAVSPDNWDRTLEIAESHPMVYAALGVHPQCVRELSDEALAAAIAALPQRLQHPKIVAVGELGLDHRWDTDDVARARQLRAFERQLDIATDLKLPPIIHCLDAHGVFEATWRSHRCRTRIHGIMHSYSGSAELVRTYTSLNLFISYSGAVTWTGAKRVPRACAATPDAWLLIETDAPYQPPHPLENAPNRPDRVKRVAQVVAQLRGDDAEHIAALTTANARRAFGLDRV